MLISSTTITTWIHIIDAGREWTRLVSNIENNHKVCKRTELHVRAQRSREEETQAKETLGRRKGIPEKPVLVWGPVRPRNSATAHRPRKNTTQDTNVARDQRKSSPGPGRTRTGQEKSRHRNTPGPGKASEPATRDTKAVLLYAFLTCEHGHCVSLCSVLGSTTAVPLNPPLSEWQLNHTGRRRSSREDQLGGSTITWSLEGYGQVRREPSELLHPQGKSRRLYPRKRGIWT